MRNDVQVFTRIDRRSASKLEALARREDRSVAAIVRRLILEHLARLKEAR